MRRGRRKKGLGTTSSKGDTRLATGLCDSVPSKGFYWHAWGPMQTVFQGQSHKFCPTKLCCVARPDHRYSQESPEPLL